MTRKIEVMEFGTEADAFKAEAYWSKRIVMVNDTARPIWYGTTETNTFSRLLEEAAIAAFEDYCLGFGALVLSNVNRPDFNRYLTLALKSYGLRTAPISTWAMQVAKPIRGRYPDYQVAIKSILTDVQGDMNAASHLIAAVFCNAGNCNGYYSILSREFSFRIDSPSAMMRIDWRNLFASLSFHEALTVLVELSQVTEQTSNRIEHVLKAAGHFGAIVPVTNPVFVVAGATRHVSYINLIGIRAAAKWALLTMIKCGCLLMPLRWNSLHQSELVYGANWWPHLGEHMPFSVTPARRLFSRLICTSTVESPADFSVDLCRRYSPAATGMSGSMEKGFAVAVQRFLNVNPELPEFPLGEINSRRKQLQKEDREYVGSPHLLREAGFPEWAVALEAFYKLCPLTKDGLRAAVKPLLDWAIIQKHKSPWSIQTKNLLNPLDPGDKSTFHTFLLDQSRTTKRVGWSSAARFYRVVYNALKPLPEYDAIILRNPFQGLGRPFKDVKPRTPIGKTFRRLIPEHLLRAMLDTLLDCDSSGSPQYTWVKKRFPDIAERFNHVTKQHELAWHPARTRCLAVLLLIPLRGKQARWLDQGLMDERIWNVETDKWVENIHPLRNYHYANSQTHGETYGRSSGVLQPIEALLGENESHIGLFISTNKTQLWNAEKRAGYSIPWPDGKELTSSPDTRIREQGHRLGLVYRVIRDQIRWMQIFDPEPVPVNFKDDNEDFESEIAVLLPVFCPIFRDLMSPATRDSTLPVHVPVSPAKIKALFHALAEETEARLMAKGHPRESIGLTVQVKNLDMMIRLGRSENITRCAYDIHSLRVAGITHLLEMGVPAHIVSEFIAGHMALVMTLHYAKFQPLKLRQKILDSFNEAHAIQQFEAALSQPEGIKESPLVHNEHFDVDDRPDLSEVFTHGRTWRYVNGGICPGASCDQGGIRIVSAGKSEHHEVEPVHGGPESCGNCRFFLSSPSFLVPQMLTANSIMLQLRELGRHRKRLWDERAPLELSIFEKKQVARSSVELATITAELERLERKIEPLVLEWYNRYEMFRRSLDLLEKSKNSDEKNGVGNPLVLMGAPDGLEMSAQIDPQGTEYLLVKEIVSQSELIGGRRPVSELAEHKLREFIDQILVRERVTDLLLTIPDPKQRRKSSLMLADALEMLAGGAKAVSDAIDGSKPIGFGEKAHKVLCKLAAQLTRNDSENAISELEYEFSGLGVADPVFEVEE